MQEIETRVGIIEDWREKTVDPALAVLVGHTEIIAEWKGAFKVIKIIGASAVTILLAILGAIVTLLIHAWPWFQKV
jgi:hypothetical protein